MEEEAYEETEEEKEEDEGQVQVESVNHLPSKTHVTPSLQKEHILGSTTPFITGFLLTICRLFEF